MLPCQKEMLGFLGKKEMATTLKNNLVLLVNLLQELKMTFIISLCLSLFFKREKTIGKKTSHILLMCLFGGFFFPVSLASLVI